MLPHLFEHRNFKLIVYLRVYLSQVITEFTVSQARCPFKNQPATTFRYCKYDKRKIIHQAYKSKTIELALSLKDVAGLLLKEDRVPKAAKSPIIMKFHSSVKKIIRTTKLIPFHPGVNLMGFSSLYTCIKLFIPLVSTMHLSELLPPKSAWLPPVLTQESDPHCSLKSFPPHSWPLIFHRHYPLYISYSCNWVFVCSFWMA